MVTPERVLDQAEADKLTLDAVAHRKQGPVDDDDEMVMDTLVAETSCRRPVVEQVVRSSVALALLSGNGGRASKHSVEKVLQGAVAISLITGCQGQPQACVECFWSVYRLMILISIVMSFTLGALWQQYQDRPPSAARKSADTTTSEQDSEDNAVDGCASSSQCRSKAKAKPRSSPMPKTSPKGKAKPKAARAQPKNSVASRGIAARRPTQTEEDAYVTPDDEEELGCPICGAPMTFRRANAGGCFRGCTRFPTCRGTRRPFDP